MALDRIREWRDLVGLTEREEEDQPRVERLVGAVLAETDSAEIHGLVTTCGEGTPEERYAAFAVVLRLLRQNDPRLAARERNRCLGFARGIATRQFPRTRLGLRAFRTFREMDSDGAEELLITRLRDASTMTDQQARCLVLDLGSMGSRRGVAALRAAKGLPPGAAATRDWFIKRIRNERPELLES